MDILRIGKYIRLTPTWGTIQIAPNKSFEYQIEFNRFHGDPFQFSCRWTTQRDHAGLDLTVSLYNLFWLNLNIHDHRHWNYDEDRWMTLEEEQQEDDVPVH